MMHRFEKQTYDKVCDSYWVNARFLATPSFHYRDRTCSADSALTVTVPGGAVFLGTIFTCRTCCLYLFNVN